MRYLPVISRLCYSRINIIFCENGYCQEFLYFILSLIQMNNEPSSNFGSSTPLMTHMFEPSFIMGESN